MQIIPAIDLLDGQVVHAHPGARKDYLPVRSYLTKSTAPDAMIDALLDVYPFETIYLADLDAIDKPGSDKNKPLIDNLLTEYPRIKFWLDAGVSPAHSFPDYANGASCLPVYGTENKLKTPEFENMSADFPEMILSLDFNAAELIDNTDILHNPAYWPANIIVMSLDKVGSGSGPDIAVLNQVKNRAGNRKIFAAGGIRNKQDMRKLHKNGIHGGLLATALHNGTLNKSDLLEISAW